MSQSRETRLALLLKAIDDEERHFAELKADHKSRMEVLYNQAYALRQEILSGQMTLIESEKPA